MSFKEISLDVADALRHLTQWTSALAWEDVPEDVRERAALIFSDDFAAMVAARNEPELLSFREGVSRSSGRSEATILEMRIGTIVILQRFIMARRLIGVSLTEAIARRCVMPRFIVSQHCWLKVKRQMQAYVICFSR